MMKNIKKEFVGYDADGVCHITHYEATTTLFNYLRFKLHEFNIDSWCRVERTVYDLVDGPLIPLKFTHKPLLSLASYACGQYNKLIYSRTEQEIENLDWAKSEREEAT